MSEKHNEANKVYVLKGVVRGPSGETQAFYESFEPRSLKVHEKSSVVGKHVYGNFYGVSKDKLKDLEFLKNVVIEAAKIGKMHIVDIAAYKFKSINSDDEGGVSIVAIILESHIAIHTWPEKEEEGKASKSYATVDIYSCGNEADPFAAFEYVVKMLQPKMYTKNYADRSNNLATKEYGEDALKLFARKLVGSFKEFFELLRK